MLKPFLAPRQDELTGSFVDENGQSGAIIGGRCVSVLEIVVVDGVEFASEVYAIEDVGGGKVFLLLVIAGWCF